MTVSTATSRSGPYAGAGTTGPFTVNFRFLDAAHLEVIRTDGTGEHVLVLSTDYTVAGVGNPTGSVTLLAALPSGQTLTIIRSVPVTQEADYVQNDDFPAQSHENVLDKLTMISQQLTEAQGRALALPASASSSVSTKLPVPEANKLIGWNAAANGLQNMDGSTIATVVAFGTAKADVFSGTGAQTAFILTANPGAQANLDVAIGGVTQRPGIDYTWSSGTTLTFTTAPPLGANNVLARYMQALPQGVADLAAATGTLSGSQVGFIQSGISAGARTGQDKSREQPLTPKDFGGIGDGLSHPLSTLYTTLAAAQSVYPFATALTQQIDWCAVVAMFRRANITKQECKFLAATWYVVAPLEVIGSSTAAISTELGNFKISGESMHNSILVFNFSDDSKSAMPFANGSSGWDISDFRIKNIAPSPYFGTGFFFDNIYTSNVRNLHAFHFNIGVEKTSYISSFDNVVGAYCNCGIYDHGGTSTTNTNLYGASCVTQPGDLRGPEYAGCGYFIKGGVYSKFVDCASDANEIAYKVKTSEAYNSSNPSQIITFDNCGLEACGAGYWIDAQRAAVTIINPSVYNVTNNKLAHVENAIRVVVRGYSDTGYHKVTLGANVGPGVVKLEDGFSTGGNPATYPLVSVPSVGQFGIGDFMYEGLAPLTLGPGGTGTAEAMAIGRMITTKNQIEFELYARNNGACATAKIEVSLLQNYSGANIDRAGTVFVCASNASNYIETGCISKTNAGISVTETQIMSGPNVIGMRYLIKPFNGLASNPTNTVALFRVETVFSPVGADGFGKNHNIKLLSNYTGRVNCRLKGVDY